MFEQKFNDFMQIARKKYEKSSFTLFFALKIAFLIPAYNFISLAINIAIFGEKFNELQAILGFTLSIPLMLYLLLIAIFKYRFNYYLDLNIFKSFFAFIHLHRLTFNWHKFNSIDIAMINIVKTFAKKNLALQGSLSILWANNNFYRNPNDIDLISMSSSDKYLLNDIDMKNKSLEVQMDNLLYKFTIEGWKIEILQPKLFATKFFKKKNGVFIPKLTWQVAMKFEQIFNCIFVNDTPQEKVDKIILDLAFLLTSKIVCTKRVLKAFVLNSLSNLFVKYFTNNMIYSFDDKEYKIKLNSFFGEKLLNTFNANHLAYAYKKIFNLCKKIVNNKWVKEINLNMHRLLNNKDDLYKELLSFANIKSLSSLKIDFDSKEERDLAFSKITISPNVAKILNNFPSLIKDKKQIDVRYYLLSKLSI